MAAAAFAMLAAALACTALAAPTAHAATSRCPEPGADWPRQSPAAAGMDAAKLQEAMDYVEGTRVRIPVTIKRPLVTKAKKRRR